MEIGPELLNREILPNLKHLNIIGLWTEGTEALLSFIKQTKLPLESISFQDVYFEKSDDVIDHLVLYSGEGLKDFQLNGPTVGTSQLHNYLTPSQIYQLQKGCPNISSLDIDVPRGSIESLSPVMKSLSSLSSIRDLVLRFDSEKIEDNGDTSAHGRAMTKGRIDPLFNKTSSADIFRFIRQQDTVGNYKP